MRISDWSSDVCSSDLEEDGETGNSEEQIDPVIPARKGEGHMLRLREHVVKTHAIMKNDDGQSSQATKRIQFLQSRLRPWFRCHEDELSQRSEEHTSELQSLMRISYAVFAWTKKQTITNHTL